MIKSSIIISFYNRTDYLSLILTALEKQTFRDFEIIIGDDGSSPEKVNDLENLSLGVTFPLTHLWHEDHGFRKNIMLNKAISAASSDYIIFIDGDCIPHPEFLKEHYASREKGFCLTGRRVNLSEKITHELTEEEIKNGRPENLLFRMFTDSILGGTKDPEKGMYFRSEFLRKFFNKKHRGLLGCNFSAFKEDLAAINGFDERYTAPSVGEDSDIEYRLRLNGVRIRSLNNIAVQYHLYHKLQPRPQQNLDLFEEVKKEGKAFTRFGIVK